MERKFVKHFMFILIFTSLDNVHVRYIFIGHEPGFIILNLASLEKPSKMSCRYCFTDTGINGKTLAISSTALISIGTSVASWQIIYSSHTLAWILYIQRKQKHIKTVEVIAWKNAKSYNSFGLTADLSLYDAHHGITPYNVASIFSFAKKKRHCSTS